MVENKRGVSEIIITVIMVGVVLAAVIVVWYVINNVISGQTEGISLSEKCLGVSLTITGANCSGTTCDILVKRSAGGETFNGLKMVFYNSDGTTSTATAGGNIVPLETAKRQAASLSTGLTKVEISPYFNASTGEAQICSQVVSSSVTY